jgi:chromosomal replication initiation ATPase DnaA
MQMSVPAFSVAPDRRIQGQGERPREIAHRLNCERVLGDVALSFKIPSDRLLGDCRAPDVSLARQVAIYLAHVVHGIHLAKVARAFGRHRSTAAYACHKIEDKRDDPDFDWRLELMEREIKRSMEGMSHDL